MKDDGVPGLAFRCEATGLVYVAPDEGDAEPRFYTVLADGGTFLFDPALEGSGSLQQVPRSVHASIRAAHPELDLSFPPVVDAGGGLGSVPAPARPLLWVDPMTIRRVYEGDDIRELIHLRGGPREGTWDEKSFEGFEKTRIFQAMRDYLVGRRAWESTSFFKLTATRISEGTPKFGCATVEEFQARGADIRQLYDRIRDEGYRSQAELGNVASFDEIRIAIDRNGRLVFLDGRHRFAIALLLKLPSVPVHVAVRHAKWHAFKRVIRQYAVRHSGRLQQPIDHPDLAEFPSVAGNERRDLVNDVLSREGLTPGEAKIADLNSHWGYHAQQLERRGFQCVVVVSPGRDARFAHRLRVATESSFKVVESPIERVKAVRSDVVLALGGPEWLDPSEPLRPEVPTLFRRMAPAIALVEPRPLRRKDVGEKDPAELVGALASEARLPSVERLSWPTPGGPIFLLRR